MSLIARSHAQSCTFRMGRSADVWFVTKDHAFYGDYLSRAQALAAAHMGARAMEAQGASAEVLEIPGDMPSARPGPRTRR